MSRRGLTTTSESSLVEGSNPLFPRIGASRRAPSVTSDPLSRGSMDSAQHLGTIFKGDSRKRKGNRSEENANIPVYATVFDTGDDTDDASSTPSKSGSYNRYGDDEQVDLSDMPRSSYSDDTISLNTSILRSIADKVGGISGTEPEAGNSKLKFLSLYEEIAKRKGSADGGSVFNLSSLDDFTRFLRKSELNDAIQHQVRENSLARDGNLLSVVDPDVLDQNFMTDRDGDTAQQSSRRITKLKWLWSYTDKEKYATKSEFNELHVAGDSSGSSDANANSTIFLQRKLKVRHLQMISFGATLGVGLYLNSGKAFTIAGGLGTVLAFVIVGIIVLATISSFCEMVTFVSVIDGVSGLSARFVDESFGFATGWLYFLSFSVGLAGEIVASVIILSYFPDSKISSSNAATVGWVSLFLFLCVISNLIDVRVFGEIEYVASLVKVVMTLIMIVVMIVINRGALGKMGVLGFKFWDYNKSNFDHDIIFGLFRPSFDLESDGMDPKGQGIGGNWGRFLSVLAATLIVAYAYSGTEIVCVAACEAKDPRKALPSATKRVFWRILFFYCIASFVVSLNIYAGDPRLLRYYTGTSGVSPATFDSNYAIQYVGGANCNARSVVYAGYSNGSQSPWSVALQSAGLCEWSSVANAFLVFFALSCGNSQLYVSSRTIYSLALQHKAPAFLKKCNRFGIPYYAVLIAATPALSSYICVSELATVVFQNLTSIISSSGVFVWFSMCLSFIRFYYGLKKRPDIIGRDDKSYPYRSPFQPYSAIIGLIGSGTILISMGFVVFIRDHWDTMFFFSSYGSLILFAVLYFGYKVVKGTRILSLEALDFDSGRREMDIYVWDGGKEYNTRNIKDLATKFVDFMA